MPNKRLNQNWIPLLQSLLAWVSKFPPLSQLSVDDRVVLLEQEWHLIFVFHFMCQFGKVMVESEFLI